MRVEGWGWEVAQACNLCRGFRHYRGKKGLSGDQAVDQPEPRWSKPDK